jgi:hypothetical protein
MSVERTPTHPGEGLLPRCCERHADVAELAEHLVREYAPLDEVRVLREVDRARAAAAWVALEEDRVRLVELVARAQLEVLAGRRSDSARLDPERHSPRALVDVDD